MELKKIIDMLNMYINVSEDLQNLSREQKASEYKDSWYSGYWEGSLSAFRLTCKKLKEIKKALEEYINEH